MPLQANLLIFAFVRTFWHTCRIGQGGTEEEEGEEGGRIFTAMEACAAWKVGGGEGRAGLTRVECELCVVIDMTKSQCVLDGACLLNQDSCQA